MIGESRTEEVTKTTYPSDIHSQHPIARRVRFYLLHIAVSVKSVGIHVSIWAAFSVDPVCSRLQDSMSRSNYRRTRRLRPLGVSFVFAGRPVEMSIESHHSNIFNLL